APCGDFEHCVTGADCMSNHCDALTVMCLPTSCFDGAKDGTETDVDCGGGCHGCALGQVWKGFRDCASLACDGITFTCDPNPCTDRMKDNEESDVDCGGACPACSVGQTCGSNFDCVSGHFCNGSHVCQ